MKLSTKFVTAISVITLGLMATNSLTPDVTADSSGAPAARTGSPGDGLSCTGCHSGTAATMAGLITSTIPASGYIPGTTYTITASITQAGKTKFGFEVSPQNPAGTKLGTLVRTDATNTKLVGSNKYITHTTAGNAHPSGTATWTFNWTAPAAGSGAVTFYGAFNVTNSSGTSAGDAIKLSTLVVNENLAAGIAEIGNDLSSVITAYPNPVEDKLNLSNSEDPNAQVKITIIDLEGRIVKKTDEAAFGESVDVSELAKGLYVLRLETDKGIAIKKIVKN